jgi:uncharacterized protein YqiB (DUF1249 family)
VPRRGIWGGRAKVLECDVGSYCHHSFLFAHSYTKLMQVYFEAHQDAGRPGVDYQVRVFHDGMVRNATVFRQQEVRRSWKWWTCQLLLTVPCSHSCALCRALT